MHGTWADFEQSLRRAPARQRVLLMLSGLGSTYARPLAKAAQVDHRQLSGILYGDPPRYSARRALVPLGLARLVEGRTGRVLEITDKGRRKARQVTARGVREHIRRTAVKRSYDGPVLDAESALRAGPPAPASLETSRFTWTWYVPASSTSPAHAI